MTPNAIRWVMGMAVAATIAAAVACGGGSSSPTSPSDSGGGSSGGGTVSDTATITITSAGVVSPSAVTIRQGGRVTFVNNDSRAHDVASDPHPTHEDCPAMDQAGFLNPASRAPPATSTSSAAAASTTITCRAAPACRAASRSSRHS